MLQVQRKARSFFCRSLLRLKFTSVAHQLYSSAERMLYWITLFLFILRSPNVETRLWLGYAESSSRQGRLMSDFGEKPEKRLPLSSLCPGYSLVSSLHPKSDGQPITGRTQSGCEVSSFPSLKHFPSYLSLIQSSEGNCEILWASVLPMAGVNTQSISVLPALFVLLGLYMCICGCLSF